MLDLPVRRGLVDFLVQKAVEAAATAAVGLDCCSASAGAAVILEHESLLARAGEVLHGGKKATKEDVRTALAKAGRADLCKRLEVQTRGRRAAAHPDPGLCRQVLSAIRPVQAKQKEPQEAVIVDRATAKPEEFGEETKEQGTSRAGPCHHGIPDNCWDDSCSHHGITGHGMGKAGRGLCNSCGQHGITGHDMGKAG